MATTKPGLRLQLQAALQALSTGDLRTGTTALLSTLGYASNKTIDLPAQPVEFAKALTSLLSGTRPINAIEASLPDWKSAAFLFQLTNDELPALAAGQLSLLGNVSGGAGGVQAHQVESFVFLALDLNPATGRVLIWPS